MKSSEILEAARNKIELGHERFICKALAAQRCELGHLDGHRIDRLTMWVRQSIGPHSTLESWLEERGYDVYGIGMYKKCRETRLAWLDHMINVCKNEGD